MVLWLSCQKILLLFKILLIYKVSAKIKHKFFEVFQLSQLERRLYTPMKLSLSVQIQDQNKIFWWVKFLLFQIISPLQVDWRVDNKRPTIKQ